MQENLARGLSVVSRAVSSRSTLPVLANVLLRTEDAGLKLTATNLEIGITYWVPGKIETDGATTVPARLLTDLVELPARLASASTSSSRAPTRSTCGAAGSRPTSRASTRTSSRPSRPPASARRRGSSQKVMKRALEETIFAAASDEARPILTGVLARFEGSKLTLAAADNYRIAVRTIDVLDPVEAASVVIPARALGELARILSDTDDPVELVLAQARNQVLFHLEGVDLVSPAHRRPVPELPDRAPGDARHAGRARSRGAAAGRPPGRAHRELVGEHRQAPGGSATTPA